MGIFSRLVGVYMEISDDFIVLVQGVMGAFTESILTCCDTCNNVGNAHHGKLYIHSGRLLALVCWYVFSISQLNELHDIMSRQQKNHDVVLGAEFSDRDHRKG